MASNQVRVTGTYRDGISAGLLKAKAEATALGIHFGKLEKATHSVGSAFGHASGQLRGLAMGPLGLIGVTGGLLSFGGAIEASIGKVETFGGEVKRLSALTGLAAETTSALSRAFEHFDVSAESSEKLIGFLEKNLGNLASRKGAIADFQQKFGLGLTDQNGKLKDANELILQTADYFNNKSIPSTTKAAALATLYGRSWQDLIPVLAAGRDGIAAAEDSARDLGLTLTTQNLQALKESRRAARDFDDALGGLQVQIGLALLPALDELAKSATAFVKDNRAGIVEVFRGGAKFAGQLGDAIKNDVLPAFDGISKVWGAIPEPLKQLLIAGTIGGKVSKFLFDFGPLDIAKALKGGLGGLLGRGSTPATPMFTKDVGGLGGGAAAAGGAGGKLGTIAKFAGALGLATIAVDLYATQLAPLNDAIAQQAKDIKENTAASFKTATMSDLQSELAATVDGFNQLNALGPLSDFLYGDQKKALEENIRAIQAEMDARKKGTTTFIDLSKAGRDTDKLGAWPDLGKVEHSVSALDKDTQHNLQALIHATKDASIRKYADKLAHDVAKGAGNTANTAKYVQELKAKLKEVHDPKTKAALQADLRKVEGKLPNRTWVDKELAHAAKIEASTASAKTKIAQLRDIQADLKAHGDMHAAGTISKAINLLKPHIDATTSAALLTARAVETLGGSSSGLHASGGLWMTNGPTRIGARDIAGEAGGEAIAIISKPRTLAAPAQAGGMLTAVPVPVPSNWTPSQQRAFAEEAAPHIARWMQQNGHLPRFGTGLRG